MKRTIDANMVDISMGFPHIPSISQLCLKKISRDQPRNSSRSMEICTASRWRKNRRLKDEVDKPVVHSGTRFP